MSDDLDNASIKRLNATIDALREDLADAREDNRVLRKKDEMRADIANNALKMSASALSEHDKRIDKFFKLVREVMGEERKAVGVAGVAAGAATQAAAVLKRVTQEMPVYNPKPVPDQDEITGQHIKLRWSTIGSAVKAAPLALKVLITAGALVAAGWRLISQFIHLH